MLTLIGGTAMRAMFILLYLCIASMAWAQPQAVQKPSSTTQSRGESHEQERGSEKSPLHVQLLNTGKSEKDAAQEAERVNSQESTERWTIGLTIGLVLATIGQIVVLGYQASQLKRTVRSSERASMPYLYPRITAFNLYPDVEESAVSDEMTHHPGVKLAFNNLGKTPAIVRRVRAELILISRDMLPPIPPTFSAGEVQSDTVIAPESTAGTRTWSFNRIINATEIRELIADTKESQYRRFFLYGYVVYDDFFGTRHTRRFCIKARQHRWQALKGGSRYNGITESLAPETEDPLSIRVEETE
jgi:hypothetical protein